MTMMIRQPRQMVREMTIQQALEWAFAVEHARLDFDDEWGAHEFDRPGCDSVHKVAMRGILGCRVDGGGSSDPHPDAQIIAAAVEALPVEVGGRKMAVLVAEMARTRSAPDWSAPDQRGIVPCGWELTEDGTWTAATRTLEPVAYRYALKRETRTYRPVICPISYSGSAAVIAERRRAYLAWYGALLHLWSSLAPEYALTCTEITDGLPELSPWKGA